MNKKLIWIIVILVVLIGTLIGLKAAGVIGKEEGIRVTMEKAAKGTIIETVNASGKIYPEVEVKVTPDISGEIVELNVAEGDSIKRGTVVAKIYADIYASQRDQAAAGVAQSEAQQANASAALGSLEANVTQAKTTFDRQKKLLDEKVISKAEFEQADQAYKVAQANLKAAKEGLKGNSASIQSAKANLNRASKDMSRATITAPMDGVVSLLSVKKGERVAGNSFSLGTEMMRIADLNSIVAQVDVGENDIPKVKFGDTAIVEIDAYSKRKFKGIVFKIANPSSSGNAITSTNDVTNYKVHIRLLPSTYMDLMGKGKPFPFRPNMSASADIQTHTVKDVLIVPLQAVTTRDKKSDASPTDKKEDTKPANTAAKNTNADDDIEELVFVLQKDGKVKKVKVKTGVQDINNIQITEGLKEGDEVITGPYSTVSRTLKEGTKVKVVAKDKLYDDKKTN
jgi:HlyD family secretion protein